MSTIPTRAAPHADFTRADYKAQWQGRRLMGLWVMLNQGVDAAGPGVPCTKINPAGVSFTLTRGADGRRVLRVAQSTPVPEDVWERQLATIVTEFVGPVGWDRHEETGITGMATRFYEPLTLL